MKRSTCLIAVLTVTAVLTFAPLLLGDPGLSGSNKELRTTTSLDQNWKFVQNDGLTEDQALAGEGPDWKTVNLPHTWNAEDAATTKATRPYKRGLGWYRLEFDTPQAGARKWLQFDATSIVADVWLNGQKLGQHKGAFTAYRFDVTDRLASNGKNVLLVRADNRAPVTKHDPTAIIPLEGDFNMSGGLYRHVSLITTADPVHFDLNDLGASGVYATTKSISGSQATVTVRAIVKADSEQEGDYVVSTSLVDADGRLAQNSKRTITMTGGGRQEVVQDLNVSNVHLWQGVEDPYQYNLVIELLRADNTPIDRVEQNFGVRQMRFDPDRGFFLNGKHVRLHGVAIHQDFQGKGWALTHDEMDETLGLVKEIGANTVRFGHYPFDQYMLDSADRIGLVVWAEVPFGIGVTVQAPIDLGKESSSCPQEDATPEFRANAKLQLQEMIRQQYNHACVGMWSIGNETTFMSKNCLLAPYDNITPVLRELQALAKQEDPTRVTTLADFTSKVLPPLQGQYIAVGGISDIWAINQYYLWYSGSVAGLGELLDALHARYPDQPIGMSEYGAGAALTHHSDNPIGGLAEVINTGVPVVYQPEEYASYVHEQNYAMLISKPYIWGTYVWNMFDFGSGLRNEGDLRGVNTKGLVTFDRKIKKDPFYFYKANWSREPVVYLTSKRYTNRAYPIADVKVYSNADSVELFVNGRLAASMKKDQVLQNTYVFKNVKLKRGQNRLEAVGSFGDKSVNDLAEWSLDNDDINIAAGQLTTGFTSSDGARFGSENFYIGGSDGWLVEKGTRGVTDWTSVSGTGDLDLFKNYRFGRFSYFIPLENGNYQIKLAFLEPGNITRVGYRIFDVVANGVPKIRNLDVLKEAGEYRRVITRTFTSQVTDGHLKIDFVPTRGEAVVSNLMIRRQP